VNDASTTTVSPNPSRIDVRSASSWYVRSVVAGS
jgi:hypothetical protein